MIIAYGKVFREIREEKGISVRETAKGIVSNSFLSKYELGKSNISFENLFLLLDRINCTITEFIYRANGYKLNSFGELVGSCRKAYEFRDYDELWNLIEKQKKLYESTKNSTYKVRELMIKAALQNLEKYNMSSEEKKYLFEYLFNVETWGYFELSIFGNSISVFNDNQLVQLSKECLNNAPLMRIEMGIRKEIYSVILNVISQLICREKLLEASTLIQKLEIHDCISMNEKATIRFFEGIIKIMRGENSGIDECTFFLKMLKFVGNGVQFKEYKKFFNAICDEYMTHIE
ncbi:helix-turn-helix domain-containing protein [Lactobacillus intestinalis]|uniref:helix-turn-helix domain-containing protein n=1 Tax=Lactobacillus intestinalis TaxID=151781 RepID=UPI0025A9D246|nr:Rgg/GadR/MutR family transcriptional regulator [Lactobacillus intestinalis]